MPIIDLEINTQDIYDQFDISSEQMESVLDAVVKEITASFARKWEEEAKLGLHSSRERYLANLKVIDEGRMTGVVLLDYTKDPLVRMIEEGASAFDQKEGFAKSDKRIEKDDGGWYLTIPLSQKTQGTDSTWSGSVMPKEVYQAVKKLDPGKSLKLSLNKDIPSQYKAPSTRAAFTSLPTSRQFEEYKHKSSIYQGILKIKDSTTGQNSYMSFRRVSDKSDPAAWTHPGLDSRNIGGKAYDSFNQSIEVELTQALDNALQSLGII